MTIKESISERGGENGGSFRDRRGRGSAQPVLRKFRSVHLLRGQGREIQSGCKELVKTIME